MNIKINRYLDGRIQSVLVTAESQQDAQQLLDLVVKGLLTPEEEPKAEPSKPETMTLDQLGEVMRHCADNKKIDAIKAVRTFFPSLELKGAKEFVDKHFPPFDWRCPST